MSSCRSCWQCQSRCWWRGWCFACLTLTMWMTITSRRGLCLSLSLAWLFPFALSASTSSRSLSPALPPTVLFPLVYLLVLTRFGLCRQAAFAFCLLLYFYYFRQPRFAHPLSALTHTHAHTPIHTHTHVLTHMSAKIVYASLFYSIWLIFAGGLFFAGFYSHSQFRFPFRQRLLNLLRIYCKSYAKFARHLCHVATANWKVAQRKYEIASLWVLNLSSSGIGRND